MPKPIPMQEPNIGALLGTKKRNEFSIIIPVVSCKLNTRKGMIGPAIESIIRQTYPYWELIVVDDGCRDEIPDIIAEYAKKDKRIKIITHEENKQRAISRNDGMKAATKEWICWLDSDDEYLKTYLEVLDSYISDDFPGYKCYHFGATVIRMGKQSVRETANLKEEGDGMERFKSGCIGAGSFVFHKDCLKEAGYLPEGINPYHFGDLAKKESPEIMEWFGPLYLEGGNSLGNPWGDDWYMFYKITRKFKSKALPIAPYLHFIRRQRFSFQPVKDN